MKIAALLASFLAMATAMVGHTDFDITKCRDLLTEVDKKLPSVELLKMDLLNGKWTATTNDKNQLTYLFAEDGQLHQFVKEPKGHTEYNASFWHIALIGKDPVLVLTTFDHDEEWLDIKQTCNGIMLTNTTLNESLHFDYQPIKASAAASKSNSLLMGEWTNVTIIEAISQHSSTNGAFLNYVFEADGTFEYEYGNDSNQVAEKGTWELSRDGQFLLLNITESSEPQGLNGVKVIKVNRLDDHGLILEEVMKGSEVKRFFDTENKVFTFIR